MRGRGDSLVDVIRCLRMACLPKTRRVVPIRLDESVARTLSWFTLAGLLMLCLWVMAPSAMAQTEGIEPVCKGMVRNGPLHVSARGGLLSYTPGDISWTIDSSVTTEYRSYILQLLTTAESAITLLYGPPSNTITVTVVYDAANAGSGWYYYDYSTRSIILTGYPWPAGGTQTQNPAWDAVVVHEAIHAYHDAIWIERAWAEEGMTETAAQLVGCYLYDQGIRDVRSSRGPQDSLLAYDTYCATGPDVMAGLPDPSCKLICPFWYRGVSAMFWVLMTAQSNATSRTWTQYDFLSRLNLALYNYASGSSGYISESSFYSILANVASNRVDGATAGEWLAQQPATFISGVAGKYLGVVPYGNAVILPVNPTRIAVIVFNRTGSDGFLLETPVTSGSVSVAIYNAAGQSVYTGTITLAGSAITSKSVTTAGWAQGAYRVTADITVSGTPLHAENRFIIGPALTTAQSGVGIMASDPAGGVVNTSFTSGSGTFALNTAGAGELICASLSQLPLTAQVQGINPISVPLPYTRAVIASLPMTTLNLPSGWSMVALPRNPLNPSVDSVFAEVLSTQNLWRYDTAGLSYVPYDEFAPEVFGPAATGTGYWLSLLQPQTMSYRGCSWIGTQTVAMPYAAWYLVGHPFDAPVPLSSCSLRRVSTGETRQISEAADWISLPAFWFDSASLCYGSLGLDGPPMEDDGSLRPGRGYWLNATVNDLELIIPTL